MEDDATSVASPAMQRSEYCRLRDLLTGLNGVVAGVGALYATAASATIAMVTGIVAIVLAALCPIVPGRRSPGARRRGGSGAR